MSREGVKNSKRWVVKIGSALLTAEGKGLDHERLGNLSLIHISEPTRQLASSRMPSSA